jgi:hypothetical protein
MQLNKFFILSFISALTLISCDEDDNGNAPEFEERDPEEQAIADDDSINNFLDTHFYNYEEFENPSDDFDYMVRLDTIAGENADKTPLSEEENLEMKTVVNNDVEYIMYVLKVREGEGQQPKFTDSVFTTRKIELLDLTVAENNIVPEWEDLAGLIIRSQNSQLSLIGGDLERGFKEAITDFRTATSYQVNSDGTIQWSNDYGIGAVIIPSGLAYFSGSQPSIPAYSPLIISFKFFLMDETDHDGDGIPSYMEIDGEGYDSLYDYDTDEDGLPNYSDPDDDGDGTPTKDEVIINEDGSLEFPDANGNGTPDYLDSDTFQ